MGIGKKIGLSFVVIIGFILLWVALVLSDVNGSVAGTIPAMGLVFSFIFLWKRSKPKDNDS